MFNSTTKGTIHVLEIEEEEQEEQEKEEVRIPQISGRKIAQTKSADGLMIIVDSFHMSSASPAARRTLMKKNHLKVVSLLPCGTPFLS